MQSNGDILNLNKDNQRLQQSDGNIKRAILIDLKIWQMLIFLF